MVSLLVSKAFVLIVTFTDTGYSNVYSFEDQVSCEQAKAPVIELYKSLGQPVLIECKPDNSVESAQ